jgi:hypothetical protein
VTRLSHHSVSSCLVHEVVLGGSHELVDLVRQTVRERVVEGILTEFPLQFKQAHVLLMETLTHEALPMLLVQGFVN